VVAKVEGVPLPNSVGDGAVIIDSSYTPNDKMLHLAFKSKLSVILAVDVNQNRAIDSGVDTLYGASADGARCTSYFLGEDKTTRCNGFPSLSTLRRVQDGDSWIDKWDIPIRELDPNGQKAEVVIQTWSKETGTRRYPGPPFAMTYSVSLLTQPPANRSSSAFMERLKQAVSDTVPLPYSVGDGAVQVEQSYTPSDQMLHLTFKSKLHVTLDVDVNHNRVIDPRVDTRYGATADGARCTQYFLTEASTTTCDGFPSFSTLRRVQDGDLWIDKWDIPVRELDPAGRRAEVVIETWSKETGSRKYPAAPFGKTFSINLPNPGQSPGSPVHD
jgi:hypothetical protein